MIEQLDSVNSAGHAGDLFPKLNWSRTKPEAEVCGLETRTIRDLHELEGLRTVWQSWPGTLDSDPDFFCSMVRSLSSSCRPYVIVVSRNGMPDAMLIGLRQRKKMPFTVGYRTISQREVTVLEFVYGSVRGNASEENCIALVHEVMRSLSEGEADLAVWDGLDVQSPLYGYVLRLPRFCFADHCRWFDDHWVMTFPKGLDAFLMSLERSQRSKLRRKYKKVLNHFAGNMEIRCFRTPADLESAFLEMRAIAGRTEKWRMGYGVFDTPRIRELMSEAAKRGWLRIFVLYLAGKPAAFWFGTLYQGCLKAHYVGFDSAWSEFSPGIFLLLSILEQLRDEGLRIVDFGRGNSQIKQCFGHERRVESRVQIYAPTLRGIQLNLLRTATYKATRILRLAHFPAKDRTSRTVARPEQTIARPQVSNHDLCG